MELSPQKNLVPDDQLRPEPTPSKGSGAHRVRAIPMMIRSLVRARPVSIVGRRLLSTKMGAQTLVMPAPEVSRDAVHEENEAVLRMTHMLASKVRRESPRAARVAPMRAAVLPPPPPLTEHCRVCRTASQSGDARLFRDYVEARRTYNGPRHPLTLNAIARLSQLLQDQGELGDALELAHESVREWQGLLGDYHPNTLTATSHLTQLLTTAGKPDSAEPLAHKAVEVARTLHGDVSADTLVALSNLAQALAAQGKYAEAEPFMSEDLRGSLQLHGGEHPDTLISYSNLAQLHMLRGQPEQAEPLFRTELAGSRLTHGADHPRTMGCQRRLVNALVSQQRSQDAGARRRAARGSAS